MVGGLFGNKKPESFVLDFGSSRPDVLLTHGGGVAGGGCDSGSGVHSTVVCI